MASAESPKTVDCISNQMEKNADSDDAQMKFSKKEHDDIYRHGVDRMQGMKTDTATVWIENGFGQHMIEIDQHGEQENHVNFPPVLPVK